LTFQGKNCAVLNFDYDQQMGRARQHFTKQGPACEWHGRTNRGIIGDGQKRGKFTGDYADVGEVGGGGRLSPSVPALLRSFLAGMIHPGAGVLDGAWSPGI